MHNIEKCLASGYDLVVECSNDKKTLDSIKKKVEQLDETIQAKILIFDPESFFLYLDKEIAKEASTETRIKGYRVKVQYDAQAPDVAKQKGKNILRAVSDSKRKTN